MPKDVLTYSDSFFHFGKIHGTVFVKEEDSKLNIFFSPVRTKDPNYIASLKLMGKEDYLEHEPSEAEYKDFINEVFRGRLPAINDFGDFVRNEDYKRILEGNAQKGDEAHIKIVAPDANFEQAALSMGFKLNEKKDEIVGDTKKILSIVHCYS